MLKIGAFSALSHISVRMLRYYDENGLLRPSHIDRFTGYRYYDESQLAEACRIALLRDMGFEKVEYMETAAPIFGSKRRAAMMMLGDSAMVVGRK